MEESRAAELGAFEGALERFSFGVLHVPGDASSAHQAQRLLKSLPDPAWMMSMFSVQFVLALGMAGIGLLLAVRSWWRPLIVPPVAVAQLAWGLLSAITGAELLKFVEPRIGTFLARYLAVIAFFFLFVFPLVLATVSLRPKAWRHFRQGRRPGGPGRSAKISSERESELEPIDVAVSVGRSESSKSV
ncbi:hypothetical protein MK280_02795 [Myxococcota bacterium]|nr:hypothetical protein [Myxococcota bacterium]